MSAARWLTVEEAAEHTNCTAKFIREQLRRNRLRGSKPGGSKAWRIKPEDLDAWFRLGENRRESRRALTT